MPVSRAGTTTSRGLRVRPSRAAFDVDAHIEFREETSPSRMLEVVDVGCRMASARQLPGIGERRQ